MKVSNILFTTLYNNLQYVCIISLLLILLSIKIFYICSSRLRTMHYVNIIPNMIITPLNPISYWIILKVIFANKSGIPYMYYIFQFLCGYCRFLEKEKLASLWLWIRPVILLYKPEAIEAILNNSSTIDKATEYDFLRPWLGDGLLTSTGNKWRNRRKLLTSSFHFRILEDFMPIYNEQSKILVDKIKSSKCNQSTDIVPLMTSCTLDIICETTMGVHINAQHDADHEYVKAIYKVGNIILGRIIRPWLWPQWLYNLSPSGRTFNKNLKVLHDFTNKVIKEKKESMINEMKEKKTNNTENVELSENITQRKRTAFLELLLEHHLQDASLSEEDIREEVDTFMFEGHDTTTAAISWALYNIGLYPIVQENVLSELNDIFGDDKDRFVTSEDLKSMKYLDCVLKESLRLYPSVPFIAREINHDMKLSGYKIPPGCVCVILPFMVHRNSEIYPNPEKFDPDRFLPEATAKRHPYAYIPFSAGPRNCIGQKFAMMEEKTVIANILRNFKIESVDQKDKVLYTSELVLRNLSPIRIKFTPR